MDIESVVQTRYSDAAQAHEVGLCCPVDYKAEYLEPIPQEVLDRDYGCGDPSAYVQPGDTVLDLGSGGGKICFISSQLVGPEGRVIGIDINDDMLELARSAKTSVVQRIGYDNVEFYKARIEDLQLNIELLNDYLKQNPIRDEGGWRSLELIVREIRSKHPLVADDSIDTVISNCVLNLASDQAKKTLFSEIHRVLKKGGRAVISDIVSDEDVPVTLRNDSRLWSGCISGAMREDKFVSAFANAGLYGVKILKRDSEPWQVIDGIEFRSITIIAYKGKEGPCWDHKQAAIYLGPFKRVEDDDGHMFERGSRIAVCEKTYHILNQEPYAGHFELVNPGVSIDPETAEPFPCNRPFFIRSPQEMKTASKPTTSHAIQNTPAIASNGSCCDGPCDGCSC